MCHLTLRRPEIINSRRLQCHCRPDNCSPSAQHNRHGATYVPATSCPKRQPHAPSRKLLPPAAHLQHALVVALLLQRASVLALYLVLQPHPAGREKKMTARCTQPFEPTVHACWTTAPESRATPATLHRPMLAAPLHESRTSDTTSLRPHAAHSGACHLLLPHPSRPPASPLAAAGWVVSVQLLRIPHPKGDPVGARLELLVVLARAVQAVGRLRPALHEREEQQQQQRRQLHQLQQGAGRRAAAAAAALLLLLVCCVGPLPERVAPAKAVHPGVGHEGIATEEPVCEDKAGRRQHR